MGALGQKAAQGHQTVVRPGVTGGERAGQGHETNASFHSLQRKIGNRAVGRLLHAGNNGTGNSDEDPVPPIVHHALLSPGQPLDPSARDVMEHRFGYDFGAVRVHTNSSAADSARAVNAQAYTVGSDVVFAGGRYDPASTAGHYLMAHELTHVVQQSRSRDRVWNGGLRIAPDGDAAEREAHTLATLPVAPGFTRVVRARSPAQVQREPAGAPAKAGDAEVAEYEADRKRFQQAQQEQFESIGEIVREHILKAAGIPGGKQPASSDEALKVVGRWGITVDYLTKNLPVLGKSLAGRVSGSQATSSLAQQEKDLIAALSPKGQKTYKDMLDRVRSEPFWKQHLDSQQISIFPDLSGANRYAGYTQRGTGQTADGLSTPGFVIHISKDRLNAGQTDESVATLIHELSHTLHEPNVTARALKALNDSLSGLLADHPKIAALRQGAPDPDQARQTHVHRISQMLFERTGYAEAEIFTHLQQLTHQPPVDIGGEKVPGGRYILEIVEGYLRQLRQIGLPPAILAGILRSLGRRIDLLYDARIAAAAAGSNQRKLLESNKRLAQSTLELAISESAIPPGKSP